MLCTSTGNSAGKDLGTLANAFRKTLYILVIDMLNLIRTELANLSTLTSVHRSTSGLYSLNCCRLCYCLFGIGYDFGIHFITHNFLSKEETFSFHKIWVIFPFIRTEDRRHPRHPQTVPLQRVQMQTEVQAQKNPDLQSRCCCPDRWSQQS